MVGHFFLWAFLFRGIFMRFQERYRCPVNGSKEALLGNLDGVRLPGFLREKKNYSPFPFLDPEDIKIL
jgi:hypothetical protein